MIAHLCRNFTLRLRLVTRLELPEVLMKLSMNLGNGGKGKEIGGFHQGDLLILIGCFCCGSLQNGNGITVAELLQGLNGGKSDFLF